MWHVVAFDLPSDVELRKDYRIFRKNLMAEGYQALQKSIYYRFFDSRDKIDTAQQRVLAFSPSHGDVIMMSLSDDAFARIIHLNDNTLSEMPKQPKPWKII